MFWENVSIELTRLKKSQGWLSAATGIPIATIRSAMSRNNDPGLERGVLIARAFGVSLEKLVSGEAAPREMPFRLKKLCDEVEKLSDKDIEIIESLVKTMVGQSARGQRASSEGVG